MLVGWGVRLFYVWHWRQYQEFGGDPLYYHLGAKLLANGQGMINPYAHFARGIDVQAADHPPLYMMYLAVFSRLGMGTVTWHLYASTLLGAGSIVVAGFAGREIVGARTGIIAATLVAVYPNAWRYDGMMLSETLVILLVLVSVWLAYRYWHDPTNRRMLEVGLAVGLATMARSELILMAPLLVLPLALLAPGEPGRRPVTNRVAQAGRGRAPWRRRLALLALGAAGVVAIVAPWVVFNFVRFDRPVILTENLGGTLATSNCDSVYYGGQVGYWDYFCGVQILDSHGIGPYEFNGAADRILREEAVRYVLHHKSRVPVVVAARVGRIAGLYEPAPGGAVRRLHREHRAVALRQRPGDLLPDVRRGGRRRGGATATRGSRVPLARTHRHRHRHGGPVLCGHPVPGHGRRCAVPARGGGRRCRDQRVATPRASGERLRRTR